MYYFDNAATTWPKPNTVVSAAIKCIVKSGANPNRGGYAMAKEAGHVVLETRRELCSFFGTQDPFEYMFVHNTTQALNFAIKGILKPGDHAVASSIEHNSSLRPLNKMKSAGCDVDIVFADKNGYVSPQSIASALKDNTKLLVISHASNVFGSIQPVGEIIEIAHKNGTMVLVDAAQSAGSMPLSIKDINADMVAFPAHKGLYGLQGTGVLYVKNEIILDTIIEGGTGSDSKILLQPEMFPDKFEAGTQNAPGIAALGEAVRFIRQKNVEHIFNHENMLAKQFIHGIQGIENVTVYGNTDGPRCGIVSINIGNADPGTVENLLDERYDIAIRSGYHCAPLAHKSMGTYDTGAVRFSFGYYNDERQVDYAIRAIRELAKDL